MRFSRALAALVAVVCLSASGAAQSSYLILVSNDDGVRAPGLAAVAQTLQAIGQVVIVAPADNQSGKGHSITIAEPIFRDDLTLPNGLKAIGLSATPVSTMKVALSRLMPSRPDLVVSGINRGYNLGLSAYLSGTVGAAREAAMAGIPAIAASLAGGTSDYRVAAEAVLHVASLVKRHRLQPGMFLNVNIPAGEEHKGYMVTSQAPLAGGKESFVEDSHPSGRTFYWNVYEEGGDAAEGTDVWAVSRGYVAVTPLKAGEYDASAAAALKGWLK